MFGVKPRVGHAFDAHQSCELFRTFTHQQHMLGALHDQARQRDRVLDGAHSGDGSAAQSRTIHDGRIKFVFALLIEDGTFAGVEVRIVLQDAHHRFADIHGACTIGEHGLSMAQRDLQRRFVLGELLCRCLARDRPSTSVDRDGPFHRCLRSGSYAAP